MLTAERGTNEVLDRGEQLSDATRIMNKLVFINQNKLVQGYATDSFSLSIGEDWRKLSKDQIENVFVYVRQAYFREDIIAFKPKGKESNALIVAYRENYDTSKRSLDEQCRAFMNTIEILYFYYHGEFGKKDSNAMKCKFAGHEGYSTIHTELRDGEPYTVLNVNAIKDDKLYTAAYINKEDQFLKHLNDFNVVVDTFEINK